MPVANQSLLTNGLMSKTCRRRLFKLKHIGVLEFLLRRPGPIKMDGQVKVTVIIDRMYSERSLK